MNFLVQIGDIVVRVDAYGRYCLNDLHKAAMAAGKATESHRPSEFLSNQGIQKFIAALDAELATEVELTAKMQLAQKIGKAGNPALVKSIKSVKGGKSPGTYAVELVAIRYAAWIDPTFEVRVYRTFQTTTKNKEDWRRQRHVINGSTKSMDATLQEVRKAAGKTTESHHFANEHRLINSLLTGKYEDLEREALGIPQLDFLAHFEIRNAIMIGSGLAYEERKEALKAGRQDCDIWDIRLAAGNGWRATVPVSQHVHAVPAPRRCSFISLFHSGNLPSNSRMSLIMQIPPTEEVTVTMPPTNTPYAVENGMERWNMSVDKITVHRWARKRCFAHGEQNQRFAPGQRKFLGFERSPDTLPDRPAANSLQTSGTLNLIASLSGLPREEEKS